MSQKVSRRQFLKLSGLVASSAVLAACTPATTVAPTAVPATKVPEATAVPTVEKLPPVELIYYYGGAAQKDLEAVNTAMNKILQEKINATIKLNLIDWGAYNDKMNLLFTSKEAVDLCFTAPWINNLYQNVNNENLLGLDDLLPKYAPELWASIKPGFWNAERVKGTIYGVPNQQIWVKPWGFACRKDLAEKYKFDYKSIKKWEDLDPFLAELKKNEPDITPWNGAPHYREEINGWDPLDDGVGYDDVSLVGCGALTPDLKAFNVLETPEFKTHMETMRRWYEAGYLPKETDPDPAASWKAGKYAFWSHLIGPDLINDLSIPNQGNGGYVFVGRPLCNPVVMTTASVVATTTSIAANSKNPERAMMYLNLINTDVELFNLFGNGIEGKHWVWVDKAKKLIAPPEGVAWADNGYWPNTQWEYGNTFNSYYTDPVMAENDYWKMTRDLNNSSTPSAALGFAFDRAKVQTEIANVKAAATETVFPMAKGEADPATDMANAITKVKEAGIEKIVAEMQTQLDAFKATKK